MRVRWWKYSIVPGNWKVAAEAFLEAYHVMQAHPELAMGATDDDYNADGVPYYHHGMGHVDTATPFDPEHPEDYTLPPTLVAGMEPGRFFIDQNQVLFEGTDGFATARDEYIADRIRDLPDDHVLFKFFEELYKYAEEADIPLPPPLDPNASTYGFVFPNLVFLGLTGNLLFYRFRPNGHDPNSAIFEALAMQIPRRCDMDNAAPASRRSTGTGGGLAVRAAAGHGQHLPPAGGIPLRGGDRTFDPVTQVRADDLLTAHRDRPLHCDLLTRLR